MSVDNHNVKFRDPFSVSPLPRTFYYPTPTKDVDNKVAIHSPERQIQTSKKFDPPKHFSTGPMFQLSALPQLNNPFPDNVLSVDHLSNPNDSVELRSEQLSSSVVSSIDEKGEVAMQCLSKQEENSQDASLSMIKKYIDRFRYSAPKSREDREKERAQKKNTLWWLNSDDPCHKQSNSTGMEPTRSSDQRNASEEKNRVKLTRQAVLQLDKETSALQLKADKLLSKSQLSLASSGPCVSTDGLGSSTALSDCSYRTDPQPAYRPIFVNVQEDVMNQAVVSKARYQRLAPKESSPDDVLARWRMRRKMEEAQPNKTRRTVQHRPTKDHTEMDIRLDEFRKKLFAQKALITTEDIQFERQKMKMLIDDDKEDIQDKKIDAEPDRKESHSSICSTEDPVLSRLRKITRANQSHFDSSLLTNSRTNSLTDHQNSNIHQSNIIPNERKACFNSNNANIVKQDVNTFSVDSFNNDITLNTNNTALSQQQLDSFATEGKFCLDKFQSQSVCDPKQNRFVLHNNERKFTGSKSHLHKDDNTNKMKTIPDDLSNHSDTSERKGVLDEGNLLTDTGSDSEQNPPYRQRLQAEKPCDNSNETNSIEMNKKKFCDDQSMSSKNSQSGNCVSEKTDSVKMMETTEEDRLLNGKRSKCKSETDTGIDHSGNSVSSSEYVNRDDTIVENLKIRTNTVNNNNIEVKSISERKGSRRSDQADLENEFGNKAINVEVDDVSVSKSPLQNRVHQAIGETIVDHLFDGPSMISSVDSWASMFPQSPSHSHSLHNSTVLTPSKEVSTPERVTSTPQRKQATKSTPYEDTNQIAEEMDASNDESCNEFEDDPLMKLLLQQKKEYLRKLELIESKLQMFDTS